LRSPKTFADFKDDLKQEAVTTKDAIVERAKSSAQSKLNGLVEDLKAKAAANPAAALAIGAGVTWRLMRNPPIASALIGLGIFSLWRTNASRPLSGYQPDYLEQGKQRLKEQGVELASTVAEMAGDAGQTVAAKAADLSDAAQERVKEWTKEAGKTVDEVTARVQTSGANVTDATRRSAHDLREQIKTVSVQDAIGGAQDMLRDYDGRNKLLLGVAGIAVAAALGIACEKRVSRQFEDA